MRKLRSMFTYANVIATLALFLALGGGAVWAAGQLGKNAVKSNNIAANAIKNRNLAANAVKNKNLAANAVKNKNLAANAVTAGKVKKGTLTRSQLKAGTLAGLQVAEALATGIGGFSSKATNGDGSPNLTPVALVGSGTLTGAFTPQPGKSDVLLAELRGNPTATHKEEFIPPDHFFSGECDASVHIFLNGVPTADVTISAVFEGKPPFNVEPVGSTSVPVGLLTPSVPQVITASAQGSEECGSGTTGSLRITVVELG
jgi:hypothetical protein